MPSSKKVAWSQLKVGVMAMLAFALLAALLLLMTGAENPFAEKATLYTYMNDSAALTEGSAVRLNGILVGKAKRIELTGDKDNQKAVKMTLSVERQHLSMIPEDSLIGFSAENVLGSKFLNIKRGSSSVPIKDGGTLQAKDEKDFLEVVQSAMPLLESLQTILTRINNIVGRVESGQGSIGKLIFDEGLYRKMDSILSHTDTITAAAAEGKGTLGRLLYEDTLYQEVRKTLARLDSITEGLQRGEGTAGKFLKDPSLFEELKKSSAEIKSLMADLNAGKGTAGKLLKDEALHNRLMATLDNLNATIDKVNSGQGTIGQLMANPALYEQLTGATAEFRSLMKDFRANPKKFLTIQMKIF